MSSVTVKGFEQVQAAKFKLLEGMRPSGGLGKAVTYATLTLAKGVAGRAHVATGTLRSSITPDVNGITGRVYTASNRNPVSGASASVYAPFEEARGGSHALYSTTVRADAAKVLAEAAVILIKELP
jgi:type V secretory pathway adhesin AidA